MLHDAVAVTLFVIPPDPKRKNTHDLKETKGKLWETSNYKSTY